MNAKRWFLDNGVRIFPIKYKDKVPACASWDDYRATREELDDWGNYGVALGSLGVLDSDTPEVEAWVAANAPPTPFMVKTARGVHRYYRLIGAAPHFVHRAGFTIEFRNHGQYVVGPGSTHASGVVYQALDWSWNIKDVPFFPVADFGWEDRPEGERGSTDGGPLVVPPTIKAGERHDMLFKVMRSLQARGVEDVEQLLTMLRAVNQEKCVPPIDDHELTRYIRRVARHRDREGFNRNETVDAAELAGDLIEQGMGASVAIAAAKALDPDFDPGGSKPKRSKKEKLEAEVAKLEAAIASSKAITAAKQMLEMVSEHETPLDVEEL